MSRMKRLSPIATWFVAFAIVGVALNVIYAFADWLLSWNRPTWVSVTVGAAFGFVSAMVADHYKAKAHRRSTEEPS